MRLPPHLIHSQFFQFMSLDELLLSSAEDLDQSEVEEITRLTRLGLPPVVSRRVLGLMLGVSSGFLWSLIKRPDRQYRVFEIPKGKSKRTIVAPRVGLKIIQTWLAFHFARSVPLPEHVFGFVPGRSHVHAAHKHRFAEWAISVDVENFFPSTPTFLVIEALKRVGYRENSIDLLTPLLCYADALPQGAPTSPVLSNWCFIDADARISDLARHYRATITRYADDIVISGRGKLPPDLRGELCTIFEEFPWRLAPRKMLEQPVKGRIKIHGIIVRDGSIILTKGYRNKIRAYRHILASQTNPINQPSLKGHIQYEEMVQRIAMDSDLY